MAEKKDAEPTGLNPTSLERTSDTELVITRTFNAPPRIVFEAWSNPDLVRRWWAPRSRGVEIVSCSAEVRVGGDYRYVLRHQEQGEFAFKGTYRDVTRHTRLVYTEMFEPAGEVANPDDAAVVTADFHANGSQTLLVCHSKYPTKEILEMVVATGMEDGMRETMDQLDALVATLES